MPDLPAAPLVISEPEAEALRALNRARTTEQRAATRALVILSAAAGVGNEAIADELSISPTTVLLWRRRFATDRLGGLGDAPRSGRPLVYGREDRDRVITETLSPSPEGTIYWSARRMAERMRISITTVQRIWAEAGLKPHRTETFKFSTDPDLAAKIRDVIGLYLNPPERAIVLSVDEQTGDPGARPDPADAAPMKPGQVERHSHDYKRNGTTCLFAALEVATGRVTNQATARHRHEEFLDFLNLLVRTYLRRQIHVVLDNVSSHKTPEVQQWLRRHKRFHFRFTPTFRLVDEPDRDVVRHPHPSGDPARHVRQGQGARRDDRGVHPELERRSQPVHVGEDRR